MPKCFWLIMLPIANLASLWNLFMSTFVEFKIKWRNERQQEGTNPPSIQIIFIKDVRCQMWNQVPTPASAHPNLCPPRPLHTSGLCPCLASSHSWPLLTPGLCLPLSPYPPLASAHPFPLLWPRLHFVFLWNIVRSCKVKSWSDSEA